MLCLGEVLNDPAALEAYRHSSLPHQPCMLQTGPDCLADELWQNILGQLCLVDVLNCGRVNKRLHSVSQHDTVWRCLCHSEFDLTKHPEVGCSWKDAFRHRFPTLQEHFTLAQGCFSMHVRLIGLPLYAEHCKSVYASKERGKQVFCACRANFRLLVQSVL